MSQSLATLKIKEDLMFLSIPLALAIAAQGPAVGKVRLYANLSGQEANCIAFAPSGNQFACGMADSSIKIFDAKTKQGVKVLKGHKFPARAIAWGARNRLVSGSENGEIRMWDIKSGSSKAWSGHIRAVQWIDINRDGSRILTTGVDDVIKLWKPGELKPVYTIEGKGINVYGARFDSSGTRIVAATLGGGIVTYKTANGQRIRQFGGHGGAGVNDVSLFGARVISAGRDGKAGIWDVGNGTRRTYVRAHDDWILSVATDPKGKLFATAGSDGTMKVWDMKSFRLVANFDRMNYVHSPLAWNSSGTFLVSVGQDGFLRIFSAF